MNRTGAGENHRLRITSCFLYYHSLSRVRSRLAIYIKVTESMKFNKLFARSSAIKIASVKKKTMPQVFIYITGLNAIGRETVTLTSFKHTPLESSHFDLQR